MASPNPLAVKVCEALGLDPGLVRSINIGFSADPLVDIEIGIVDINNALESVDWTNVWQGARVTVNIEKVTFGGKDS